jgi:hypothetical protein
LISIQQAGFFFALFVQFVAEKNQALDFCAFNHLLRKYEILFKWKRVRTAFDTTIATKTIHLIEGDANLYFKQGTFL